MKTRISFEFNRPALYINDEFNAPVMYALSDIPASRSNTLQASENIKNFKKAGINIIAIDTELRLGWHKVSEFDSEPVREEIAHVLDANRDAKIFMRLHLNPPYWWLRDNPEECVIYRNEDGDKPGIDDGESERLIKDDSSRHIRASFASDAWVKDCKENLIKLIKDLKDTPEGNAVFAIQVAYGIFGEWHQWGVDVSNPMQKKFKEYLKGKYKTEGNLQKAWNDSLVTFETANYSPQYFRCPDDGDFRDPQKSYDTIDSQMFNQQLVAERIVEFCGVIKEYMPDVLCGSFYGYYFNTGGATKPILGHLCPEIIYKAKGIVDFLCGPFAYMDNRKSDGVPMQRALLESLRLNGILWMTEMDQHPVGTENFVGGDKAKMSETVSVLRRNVIQPLFMGQGYWYYDHRIAPYLASADSKNLSACSIYRKNGWWNTPELMEEISNIQKFTEHFCKMPFETHSDVLVVYDTLSCYFRGKCNDEEYLLHEALTRAGVQFDCIYAIDLDLCNLSQYKCIIFANSHTVTKETRQKYHKLLKDCMIIYLNCHGYSDGKSLSEENISLSVGMKMQKTQAEYMIIADDNNMKFKMSNDVAPFFEICDKSAKPICVYNNGKVAAAIKDNKVYFPLSYIPYEIVKNLMEKVGVHIWCDSGEPIISGGGYVAINCNKAGNRNVFLPNGKVVSVITQGYETAVFKIETGERVM